MPTEPTPQLGDLWEITVADPIFTRVVGSTLCHVGTQDGYPCWRRHEDDAFWLDINDSAIDQKRFIYRPASMHKGKGHSPRAKVADD